MRLIVDVQVDVSSRRLEIVVSDSTKLGAARYTVTVDDNGDAHHDRNGVAHDIRLIGRSWGKPFSVAARELADYVTREAVGFSIDNYLSGEILPDSEWR